MRYQHGFQQPGALVRAFFACVSAYFIFSGFVLGQASFLTRAPESFTVGNASGSYTSTAAYLDSARNQQCQMVMLSIRDSTSFALVGSGPAYLDDPMKCLVTYTTNDTGGSAVFPMNQYVTFICSEGYTWDSFNNDNNPYTGVCKKPSACTPSFESCYLSSTTEISSAAATVCVSGCVVAQSLGTPEIRYSGGVQTFFYNISKAKTAVSCSVMGGGSPILCNSGAPGPQNPCELPSAASSVACGGGTGCPPNTTVLANGACTPNDSNAPCPAQSYRVDGAGACIPYPNAGAGTGSTGGGSGAAGGAGAAGSAGGAGSAGSTGTGTNGGTGGGGGGGGSGGTGGAGGAGGAAKDDVKCGATGDLCQNKFQEYFDAVKEFLAGDATIAAAGKAAIAKSEAGGNDENKLNKGPVTDLASLNLETGGGMISGGRACPAPKQIGFKGQTFAISFQPLCDFGGYIRFMLLAVCGIVCARMVLGAWT